MITDLWVQVFGVRSEKGYEKSYIENRAAHPHPKFWVVPPSPGPKRLFLGEKNQFYGQRVIAEAKDARRTGKEKREGGREGGKEGGREGGKEGGWEGEREGFTNRVIRPNRL